MKESKYKVGDRVRINNYVSSKGAMIECMLEEFGGKVKTISKVMWNDEGNYFSYEMEEDRSPTPYKFEFTDEDIEGLVPDKPFIMQRIEIPVPGGHLVAVTTDYGGDYPGIHVFFIASGDTVEHDLCFAEICLDDPDTIRVGTYFEDGSDVRDLMEYTKWKKEEY